MLNKQIFRFIIIGFLSAFINYFFYILIFKYTSNILLSSIFGYSMGILNSYIFGKKWVFKSYRNTTFESVFKFLLIYFTGGFIMTLIINFIFRIGVEYRIAWCFGMSYALINNFLGSKYFVFKK